MPIHQTTPDEAKDILDQDPKAVYLDVRSVPEFSAGHPVRAVNIPIMHKNSAGMEPNNDFLKVVTSNLPKETKLLVGCLQGGRAMRACQLLEANGYADLYYVHGGWGGIMDPMSGEVQAGWQDLGLPISEENGDGVGYESLKAKLGR